MYNGQSVVQTFNYQERAKKRFAQLNDALKNSSRKAETTAGAISPITTLVNDFRVCAFVQRLDVFGQLQEKLQWEMCRQC